MKHSAIIALCGMCALSPLCGAHAALPSLSQIAEDLTTIRTRFEEATNAVTQLRERLAGATNRIAQIVSLIESREDMRAAFHGGRIGQYVLEVEPVRTNANGRIAKTTMRIDLYRDGSVHTNAPTRTWGKVPDPEAAAKIRAEMERQAEELRAAWERANLPPALAAIREAQRAALKTNEVNIAVEGNQ